jgi:hypothetical protein
MDSVGLRLVCHALFRRHQRVARRHFGNFNRTCRVHQPRQPHQPQRPDTIHPFLYSRPVGNTECIQENWRQFHANEESSKSEARVERPRRS